MSSGFWRFRTGLAYDARWKVAGLAVHLCWVLGAQPRGRKLVFFLLSAAPDALKLLLGLVFVHAGDADRSVDLARVFELR